MNNIAVYAFGRFQPVTVGHERLISKVIETAAALNADHIVYLSQTHKCKTDPLEWTFKVRVCRHAFRNVNISNDITIKNPFIALEKLKDKYKKITLIAGSDQVEEYRLRFTPYAEKWGIEFEVISAGERTDPDEISSISATKMRQYAQDNNKEKFFAGLPTTVSPKVKELIFANTKRGLKRP